MLTPELPDIDPEHYTEAPAEARPVLLLIAYECGPNRGSQAYAGWARVLQAAREFDLHVLVSAESLHCIALYLEENPMAGVQFHTPPEDALYRQLRRAPRSLISERLVYQRWQWLAYRLAQQLHRTHCFSLVHHVNLSTIHEPGYAWQLGIPFVWGPVGDTEEFPETFLANLPRRERLKERARNLSNQLALRNRRVQKAGRGAAVLLAANTTIQRDCEHAFERPAELLLDTALYTSTQPNPVKFHAPGPLNILWSGEFTTRKALPILLEALANLGHEVDYRLRVLGKGPLEAEWMSLARQLGLGNRCTFLGQLPLADAMAEFEWAHLLVFTSLRDTSGNVVLEALGHGVPVLCFDHQGVADIVNPNCGIKLPVTHPAHAIELMSNCVRALAHDRPRLVRLSSGASARARNFLWAENGARVNSIYRRLALAADPIPAATQSDRAHTKSRHPKGPQLAGS
jgi:glycosyltransferase involved in cell wall biosynthesis